VDCRHPRNAFFTNRLQKRQFRGNFPAQRAFYRRG